MQTVCASKLDIALQHTFSSRNRSLAALQCAATSDRVMSRLLVPLRLSSARALCANSYTQAFSPICSTGVDSMV